MMEAKKCVRCGTMFISNNDVCDRCKNKDNADLFRLKGFMENQNIGEEIAQGELSIATGITNKNLSRFLGLDEFKDINVNSGEIDSLQEIKDGKIEIV